MQRYTLILLTILVAIFLTAQACQNFYLYQGPESDLAFMCTTDGDVVCDDETLEAFECQTGAAFGAWNLVSTSEPCSSSDGAPDADNDGVPDDYDDCPGFDDAVDVDNDDIPDGCDSVIGAPAPLGFCSNKADGDYCRSEGSQDSMITCSASAIDDEISCTACNDPSNDGHATCEGASAPLDSDNDGVPDTLDVCPGFDDTVDANNNGVPDFAACVDWDNDGLVGTADTSVCTDSDAADSKYVKGTVAGVVVSASGEQNYVTELNDFCTSSTTSVNEFSCTDDIFLEVNEVLCDAGQTCVSGACVSGSAGGKDLVSTASVASITNNGATLGYTITVKNTGTVAVSQPFVVKAELIGATTQECAQTIPSLSANAEAAVTCSFDFSSAVSAYNTAAANLPAPASYTYRLTLDSSNQITETSETNNIVTEPFTADLAFFEVNSAAAPVQLSVTGEYVSPLPDKPGLFNANYMIQYTIHNTGFLKSPTVPATSFGVKKSAEYLAYANAQVPPIAPAGSIDMPVQGSRVFSTNNFLNTKWQQVIDTKAAVDVAFKYTFDNWATFTPFTVTLPYPTSCVDYDGGNNNVIPSYVRQNSVETTDSCVSGYIFQQREWYCQNGVKTSVVNNCPTTSNQYCFNTIAGGACHAVTSCVDSDGTGYNHQDANSYKIVGSATLTDANANTRVATDSCDSLGRLAERTCNNAVYETSYVDCATTFGSDWVCSSGKCVEDILLLQLRNKLN